MELRQLRYFVTVAKLRNFSEASRQLNITQSTLSHQIIQLEGELGVELLVRETHHVRLTDIGAAFLPQAEKTLSTAGSCIDRIRDDLKLETGELNLGSTYTFLPLLKETVLMYMQKYPGGETQHLLPLHGDAAQHASPGTYRYGAQLQTGHHRPGD